MKLDRWGILIRAMVTFGRFSDSLPSDGSGSIDREEFLQLPQIANNPLASRLIAIFDEECVRTYAH